MSQHDARPEDLLPELASNHSLKAADVACTIAAGLKAQVILLCVVQPQELPKGLRDYANLEHISGLDIDILLKVAGDLVLDELVIGQVAVDAIHHPVPVAPGSR